MNTRRRFGNSDQSLPASAMPGAASNFDSEGSDLAVEAISGADAETEADADAMTRDTARVTVEHRGHDLQQYAGTARALAQGDTRGIGNDRRNLQVAVPVPSISNQERNLERFVGEVGSANNTEPGALIAWTVAATVLSSTSHADAACAPNTRSDTFAAWALDRRAPRLLQRADAPAACVFPWGFE